MRVEVLTDECEANAIFRRGPGDQCGGVYTPPPPTPERCKYRDALLRHRGHRAICRPLLDRQNDLVSAERLLW